MHVPITRVSRRANEQAPASANLPESMSIAGEPRYQPTGADDNGVLHNNVADFRRRRARDTHFPSCGHADKGREMRRAVAQRTAGGRQSLPTANQIAKAPVTSRRSRISRAERRNFQDSEISVS